MTSDPSQISEREREILRLVATGATNQQIAHQLNISINTVKVHLRNIFGKIGATSRTEATVYAIRQGLVAVSDQAAAGVAVDTLDIGAPEVEELAPERSHDGPAAAEAPEAAPNPLVPHSPAPETTATNEPAVARKPAPGRLPRLALVGVAALLAVAIVALVTFLLRPAATPADTAGAPGGQAAQQGTWSPRAALPEQRADFGVATYDGNIYVIGGSGPSGPSANTTRYTTTGDAWTALPAKPTAASGVQAATIGGVLYVPGGEDVSGRALATFEAYDTREQQWRALPELPEPRSRYALASVEGKLYLFGGWDGSTYRSEVFAYDPGSRSWSRQAPMPTPRRNSGAAVVEGRIYVIGGENSSGALQINESYSPFNGAGGQWSEAEPLPRPVGRPAVVGLFNSIVFVFDPESPATLQFTPSSAVWTSKSIRDNIPLSDRAASFNNSIFVFGTPQSGAQVALNEHRIPYNTFLPGTMSSP